MPLATCCSLFIHCCVTVRVCVFAMTLRLSADNVGGADKRPTEFYGVERWLCTDDVLSLIDMALDVGRKYRLEREPSDTVSTNVQFNFDNRRACERVRRGVLKYQNAVGNIINAIIAAEYSAARDEAARAMGKSPSGSNKRGSKLRRRKSAENVVDAATAAAVSSGTMNAAAKETVSALRTSEPSPGQADVVGPLPGQVLSMAEMDLTRDLCTIMGIETAIVMRVHADIVLCTDYLPQGTLDACGCMLASHSTLCYTWFLIKAGAETLLNCHALTAQQLVALLAKVYADRSPHTLYAPRLKRAGVRVFVHRASSLDSPRVLVSPRYR